MAKTNLIDLSYRDNNTGALTRSVISNIDSMKKFTPNKYYIKGDKVYFDNVDIGHYQRDSHIKICIETHYADSYDSTKWENIDGSGDKTISTEVDYSHNEIRTYNGVHKLVPENGYIVPMGSIVKLDYDMDNSYDKLVDTFTANEVFTEEELPLSYRPYSKLSTLYSEIVEVTIDGTTYKKCTTPLTGKYVISWGTTVYTIKLSSFSNSSLYNYTGETYTDENGNIHYTFNNEFVYLLKADSSDDPYIYRLNDILSESDREYLHNVVYHSTELETYYTNRGIIYPNGVCSTNIINGNMYISRKSNILVNAWNPIDTESCRIHKSVIVSGFEPSINNFPTIFLSKKLETLKVTFIPYKYIEDYLDRISDTEIIVTVVGNSIWVYTTLSVDSPITTFINYFFQPGVPELSIIKPIPISLSEIGNDLYLTEIFEYTQFYQPRVGAFSTSKEIKSSFISIDNDNSTNLKLTELSNKMIEMNNLPVSAERLPPASRSLNTRTIVIGNTTNHVAEEVDFLCDGTNDSMVFQLAIGSAERGDVILILSGTYSIDSLQVFENITICGEDRSRTSIAIKDGGFGFWIGDTVHIHNMTIFRSGTTNASDYTKASIYVGNHFGGTIIENISFMSPYGNFQDLGYAISVITDSSSALLNIIIQNCSFTDSKALYVKNNMFLSQVIIHNNSFNIIDVTIPTMIYADGVVFSNNVIKTNRSGIRAYFKNSYVMGNVFDDDTIFIDDANRDSFFLYGNAYRGVPNSGTTEPTSFIGEGNVFYLYEEGV